VAIVDELKQFGEGHARAQDIAPADYRALCARITTDEGDGPGSWVREWTAAAEPFQAAGKHLEACKYYNLARLPYVDGPARKAALDACVDSFGRWAAETTDIRPLTVETPGGTVRCWTSGLSSSRPRPLLLALGGIVSIKEQWAPLLAGLGRLGLAGVVTEMPGVGENTQLYSPDSWRMLSAVMDAVADRADVSNTFAMALSFSGHLALRCAIHDGRLRGIATVGAPVRALFTDLDWQKQLPAITVNTVAHLAGIDRDELPGQLGRWALGDDELAALDIPVYYVASSRDEVIPNEDVDLLAAKVRGARILRFDDEHGAPHHTAETRVWIMRSIVRTLGGNAVQRGALAAAWGLVRARSALMPAAA
jgi:pimeloyl-ACP methyl ester carboxylesterase